MKLLTHRTAALGLFLVGLAAVTLLTPGQALPQPVPGIPGYPGTPLRPDMPRVDPKDPHAFEASLLPLDRRDEARRKLGAALDRLTDPNTDAQEVAIACRSLQSILDAPGDVFTYIPQRDRNGKEVRDKNGKEIIIRVSARAEANRLLANMPPAHREIYQSLYGAQARLRVDDARRLRDPLLLYDVVRRYFYTTAGGEALVLLASHHLDRGEPSTAAFYFERLLQRPGHEKMDPLVHLKAVVAFHQAGDSANEARAWKLLAQRLNNNPLRIGGRELNLEQVRFEVAKLAHSSAAAHDWTVFRGDPRRSGAGQGDAPYLDPRWQAATVERPEAKKLLEAALQTNGEGRAPTLAGSFPIAAAGKLICRTAAGVAAFDLRTGQKAWAASLPLALESCYDTEGVRRGKKAMLEQWLEYYARQPANMGALPPGAFLPPGIAPPPLPPGGVGGAGGLSNVPSQVYENTVLGTLSSDRKRVYAVEDLPLQPPAGLLFERDQPGMKRPFGPFENPLYHNKIVALDLETGKLLWEVGGRSAKPANDLATELLDSYFLGPPLPLYGKLYAVAEKQGEIRLIGLDPEHGEPIWVQPLVVMRSNKLPQDVGRRLQAAPLAFSDGLLVCPTLAGAVVGVDVLSHSLEWVHVYRDQPPPGPDGLTDQTFEPPLPLSTPWKAAAPLVHEGKVIVSCPDSDLLLCLNLRDGKKLWKVKRAEDDLFVAGVFPGKDAEGKDQPRLLIVGKSACRAVALSDGATTLWTQRTGMPSGHGVASGPLYYLPLKNGQLVTLDVQKGEAAAWAESRLGPLGNLVTHEGDILSQSALAVAAFPQLKTKLAQIDRLIEKNPHDPLGLTERGELRLYQGNLPGAIADLHEARRFQPPESLQPRLRARLFEALTQLLQKKFSDGEPFLDECRELCREDVPPGTSPEERQRRLAEQDRREVHLFSLVARGREQQQRWDDALAAYRDLYTMAMPRLTVNLDDPLVQSRLDVWVQSRVRALFAGAGDARAQLEQKLRGDWKALRDGDREQRDRFVALFGGACRAGQEARLDLADLLTRDLDRGRFLDAERLLQKVRAETEDRELAGRATAGLARLALRKGRLHEAAELYRALGRVFADVVVADGKTGADVLAEMTLDRRLLGYLDDGGSPWRPGPYTVVSQNTVARPVPLVFTFEPSGPTPLALRRQMLQYHWQSASFKLIDRQTGTELWSAKAGLEPQLERFFRDGQLLPGRLPCLVEGRVAVVSLGPVVIGLDLLDRCILWRKPLIEGRFDPNRFTIDASNLDTGLQLYLLDLTGQTPNRLVARIGCVGSHHAALQTPSGLVVVDLHRGDTLWTRTDVQPEVELFGDDQYIFLLEDGGTGTRALRVSDGVAVKVPALGDAYSRQLQRLGRLLLLTDADNEGRTRLHLYDALTGKDVWKVTAPQDVITVRSEDPQWTAVIELDGTVRIFDLLQRKEVLKGTVERKHFDNAQAVRLVTDRTHFYLLPDNPIDSLKAKLERQPSEGVMTMRSVPVNGVLYALARIPGEQDWSVPVEYQELILDQIDDLPVLLFAASWTRQLGNGDVELLLAVHGIAKTNGKRVLGDTKTGSKLHRNDTGQGFHALLADPQALTIDLVAPTVRVRLSQPLR